MSLARRTPLARTAMPRQRAPLARSTPMRKVSVKERTVSRPALARARLVLIERSGGRCEMGRFSPRCTGVGVCPHHMLKQSQTGQHDPKLMRWSCWWCNEEVELRPADAHAAGLTVKSWEVSGAVKLFGPPVGAVKPLSRPVTSDTDSAYPNGTRPSGGPNNLQVVD